MTISEYFKRRITERYLEEKKHYFFKNYPQMVCYSWELISQYINTRGRFELDECENLKKFVFSNLTHKKICLDIGANIGNHSVFFSGFFENVVCFEPNPITFKVLNLNVERYLNIKAYNIGASDKNWQIAVMHDEYNIGAARIENDGHDYTGKGTKVNFNLCRLDDFLSTEVKSKVAFIKIDIEGHELFALTGLKQTLISVGPVIAFESSVEDFSNGTTPVIDLLKSYGYSFFYEFARKGIFNALVKRFKFLNKDFFLIFGEKNYTLRRKFTFEVKDYNILIGSKYQLQSFS